MSVVNVFWRARDNSDGLALRREVVAELKKKYPNASDGALNFINSYDLDEFTSGPLHTEYELEAFEFLSLNSSN